MSSLRHAAFAVLALFLLSLPVQAQLTGLARVDPEESGLIDAGPGVQLTLMLSQAVPWRVFTLDEPRRLVLDLSEAAWPTAFPDQSEKAGPVRMGVFHAGWSRMVIALDAPMAVDTAVLETGTADGSAKLLVRLVPVSAEKFATSATPPAQARTLAPRSTVSAVPEKARETLRVMLDPGHGGIDPGAEASDLKEADLMLTIARELRELLVRSGGFTVGLTRDSDIFVPLEARITLARDFGADVLISLHADALPEDAGNASGATVYTLAEEASDWASRTLAERHDLSDLLFGVDLAGQGDEIALVLMELARRDTAPRADRLAQNLVAAIKAETGHVAGRPWRQAGFTVLKAPDIPSVLVELGFLSSESDRERLGDPKWRAKAALGMRDALRAWQEEDAQRARLVSKD